MTTKRRALEFVTAFSMLAVQAAALGAPAANISKTSAKTSPPASSDTVKPKEPNPTKPAKDFDLDKESYAAFVLENGKLSFVSKSGKIKIDGKRALASHMKIFSASYALDRMIADPNLMTPQNLGRLRRGLLESSNGDMEELVKAVAPVHTDKGVRDALREKGKQLGLSDYFDPLNASGNPIPVTKTKNLYTYGTIEDVMKGAADLYGNPKKMEILQAHVYTDIKRATNFVFWPGTLFTKTATADGETKDASGAGYRTMLSAYCVDGKNPGDGKKIYFVFHPNPYGDPHSPSSTMASVLDQFLTRQGVQEDPRVANWLTRMEHKQFPSVRAALVEWNKRVNLDWSHTVAEFSPPPVRESHKTSHYSKSRERHTAALVAAKLR